MYRRFFMKRRSDHAMRACVIMLFALGVLFWSCEEPHGALGGADRTESHSPGNAVFEERLGFLNGTWYSGYPGIGVLDGYRIRQWGSLTAEDKSRMQSLFSAYGFDIHNPKTYRSGRAPQDTDYILLYDDSVYGQRGDNAPSDDGIGGTGYMGVVRALNIFNNDKDRGAVIIEYLEGADPRWLWDSKWAPDWSTTGSQGLGRGEKPFFGMYYRVLGPDTVQMANAVDLAALYAGRRYYTEKGTLAEAIAANSVENEAEFISWGVVNPQNRE